MACCPKVPLEQIIQPDELIACEVTDQAFDGVTDIITNVVDMDEDAVEIVENVDEVVDEVTDLASAIKKEEGALAIVQEGVDLLDESTDFIKDEETAQKVDAAFQGIKLGLGFINMIPRSAMVQEPYNYAETRPQVKGTINLVCIGLKWKNARPKQIVSASKARSIGRQVANFYQKSSRGLLKFNVTGHSFKVNVPGRTKNFNKAKNDAVKKFQKPGKTHYLIFSSLNAIEGKRNSNAGKGVAHLRGDSIRCAQHEEGHLLGLEHSGAYIKGKLDAYGDGHSVMSGLPANLLTAAQYYHQGWMPKDEAALLDLDKPDKVYELKRVNQFDKHGLSCIVYKRDEGRDVFISRTQQGGLVIHLSTGPGSQRVKMFGGGRFHDKKFSKLFVEKIGATDDGNFLVRAYIRD